MIKSKKEHYHEKQILLTALTLALLASAVTTAAAEEVVATILFEPITDGYSHRGSYYWYILDMDDDFVEDMYITVYLRNKYEQVSNMRSTLSRYLKM